VVCQGGLTGVISLIIRVKRIGDFSLRPGHLWRRLTDISSFYELRERMSEGCVLLSSAREKGGDGGSTR